MYIINAIIINVPILPISNEKSVSINKIYKNAYSNISILAIVNVKRLFSFLVITFRVYKLINVIVIAEAIR